MFKQLTWPKSLPFAIILFLYAVYLLSFSGKFHVMDELAVFTAGYNLAGHHRADINQLIWTNHWTPNPPGIWGQDGRLYTKKPPGISFITAPLIGLGRAIPGLNAVQVGLLTNALVTALTAGLLVIWLADLGFSHQAAALTALSYGLGTFAWVYARMFWESSLLALTFLAAIWAAYRAIPGDKTNLAGLPVDPGGRPSAVSRQISWPWLLWCGLAAAMGLTLRFEAILAVLLIGLYLIVSTFPTLSIRSSMLCLGLYLAPALVIGSGLLYFNYSRYGSLLETGYTAEILFNRPWVGAFGLLFSPGRGLFFYAPLTILLFVGLRPAWRRLPRLYFGLIAALCLGYWLFYGAWFAWGGAWGWGPRFLLPILPLLMLFVAEPIETMRRGREDGVQNWPNALRLTFCILVVLSLVVNLLGLLVDFNEHFLRLGSNDNFVFNWAAFPPLAHWHILQEGLVDLIWLQPGPAGWQIQWPVLLPALLLLGLAAVYLILAYRQAKISQPRASTHYALRITFYVFALTVAAGLTLVMMQAAARLPLTGEQAQLDQPVLDTLAALARPGDALLVALPPFGDVQEISTHLMAYLRLALPTYTWIESEPRAIQPAERARVWPAIQAEARRVWLFERWLTRDDRTSTSAAQLTQAAFPVSEQWFERSGKLTLYALADKVQPPTPLNVPFQGGLTLVDFAVGDDTLMITPGATLKLRLTWRAVGTSDATQPDSPVGAAIVFVQLLNPSGQNVAQSDRLLIDLQDLEQSPLRPGQTSSQNYGLSLPPNLPPGSYTLVAGVYNAATSQRLARADGNPDDFVYLMTVQVKEGCCE